MSTDLHAFEGRKVVATSIKVTKAGDGLSPALKVEPVEYELGEVVYLVLKTTVGAVGYKPSKDNPEASIRQHTLETVEGTIVEEAKVRGVLAAQRKAIEQSEGIERLPGLDEDDRPELPGDDE